ncbi:hypothetical protein CEXT_337741 [Caerostris extrusa]|uniref:Ig-like domain-containing protein n=1 Tax=Caerostris extrusa TaxID=172846 RepID=A0AAV4QL93_CAEEX|nr:hypothetical protein CEXT_337741 [Caerostris extrusa]
MSNYKTEVGVTRSKHLNDTNVENSVLKISSVTSDDAGIYECVADNGIPPSIKVNFTIVIRATSLVKPIKFQWHKNGHSVMDNPKNSRIEDGTSHSVLMFDSVELSDFGNYTCIAQNTDGTDTYTAELSVKAPPKWVEEPESVVTKVGGSVYVKCRATGSPMPKIMWNKLEGKIRFNNITLLKCFY